MLNNKATKCKLEDNEDFDENEAIKYATKKRKLLILDATGILSEYELDEDDDTEEDEEEEGLEEGEDNDDDIDDDNDCIIWAVKSQTYVTSTFTFYNQGYALSLKTYQLSIMTLG